MFCIRTFKWTKKRFPFDLSAFWILYVIDWKICLIVEIQILTHRTVDVHKNALIYSTLKHSWIGIPSVSTPLFRSKTCRFKKTLSFWRLRMWVQMDEPSDQLFSWTEMRLENYKVLYKKNFWFIKIVHIMQVWTKNKLSPKLFRNRKVKIWYKICSH